MVGKQGLEPHPPAPKAGALTLTLHPVNRMVRGARETRTPSLLVANETRYQLRHSPMVVPEWSYADLNCGPLPCHGSALPAELQPRGPPPDRPASTGRPKGQQFTAGLAGHTPFP